MLKIKTTIKESPIHGIGLFADQLIKKGEVTWEYDPSFDISFTQEKIDSLPDLPKNHVLFYSYFDKKRGIYILPLDNLHFINHSQDGSKINIESTPDKDTAIRDIQPGEELLCDYNKFDDTYFNRHGFTTEDLV